MYITIPIKEKQKLTATYALGKRSTESIITFQGEKLKGVGLKENLWLRLMDYLSNRTQSKLMMTFFLCLNSFAYITTYTQN